MRKLMESLSPYKAGGPDGISPQVLWELAEELAPPLTIIFQSSLSTGTVPTDWRDAYVTPIFKKGEQYNPVNCRPISLTCIVHKLMEHIMVSSIMQHFETHCILNDNQHGFRRGHSCETQLLEFVEELMTSLEGGRQTDIIILDFAKAFDRVNHSLLVHKLQCYGIRGSTITWIANFLSDQHQAVVVNDSCSSYARVRSGVPQGSVLGPCLFQAYIKLMICQRSWWPCQGCLQMTLQYTEWYTAAQTRSSFNKTFTALWNGRRAGTCYSTLPNVCPCQSPGVGVHSTTHMSSMPHLWFRFQSQVPWHHHTARYGLW